MWAPEVAALATEYRSCTSADVPAVAALAGAAFDPCWGEAWSEAQIAGGLSTPGTWLELVIVDGQPAAFVLCRRILDEVELLLCASAPRFRRHGLVRELLSRALEQSRAAGAARMFLEVRENNDAAQALYRTFGFKEVGRRRGYYRGADGQTYDALSFCRSLMEG